MDQDRLIERIRKLLALSTSSNQAEAEAAAAKAQALLQHYNLERAAVEQATGAKPLYLKQVVAIGSRQRWRRSLMDVVADAHFCKALYTPGLPRMDLIGEPHNVEVVEYLYTYLATQLERMAASAYRQSRSALAVVTWKDAFYLGAVAGLYQRLHQQQEAFAQGSEETRALVVVKDTALREAVQTYFPKVRKAPAKRVRSEDGWKAGVQAGQTVSLHPGVQPPGVAHKRLREGTQHEPGEPIASGRAGRARPWC